jgi:hypothetical protein
MLCENWSSFFFFQVESQNPPPSSKRGLTPHSSSDPPARILEVSCRSSRHVVSASARHLCSVTAAVFIISNLPLSLIQNRKFSTRLELLRVRFGWGIEIKGDEGEGGYAG